MTVGSRSSPAITSAGSPGNRCCNEKIRIDTKNNVGISCITRLARKLSMVHAWFDVREFQILLKVLATSFPPPLWGRDRERGKTTGFSGCATPHPNPPPQGGREQRTDSRWSPSLQLQPDHANQ